MPYGALNSEKLSQASRICVDRAVDWWQKSMQTSKHRTFFVLAGYDGDGGQEIKLRREVIHRALQEPELLSNIVEVGFEFSDLERFAEFSLEDRLDAHGVARLGKDRDALYRQEISKPADFLR